jgi:bifunctional aspartokinase / homoserine dehydrogenase 1
MSIEVHKFGGSSLANSYCYKNVDNIIKSTGNKKIIVVSAPGSIKSHSSVHKWLQDNNYHYEFCEKITDMLVQATGLAKNRDIKYTQIIDSIDSRFRTIVSELGLSKHLIYRDMDDIRNILRTVFLSKNDFDENNTGSWFYGYGEILSAKILSAYLNVPYIDSRDIIRYPKYDNEESKNIIKNIMNNTNIIVTTGYICNNDRGQPSTLGRDGSDYSATIFGALVNADLITIWTDVDGIYRANPNYIKDQQVIDTLSYHEASELAYFGAKVIHPKTISPVIKKRIPIRIANSFNPDYTGTLIIDRHSGSDEYLFTGISDMSNLSLITLQGGGIIGVSGIAARLFTCIAKNNISIILISQASSEYSISFAINRDSAHKCLEVIRDEFNDELYKGEIEDIQIVDNCSCISIVGDNMIKKTGVASAFFKALSDNHINILCIVQGSSERNICVIIKSENLEIALKSVYNSRKL